MKLLLAAATCLATPVHTPSQTYLAQEQLIEKMNALYPTVDVDVRWQPCDEENSYYEPDSHTITLCTEMSAHPDAALMVAAHEMGHAITDQLTDTTDENDADEVGALSMIRLGYGDELVGGAVWFLDMPNQGHIPGDPHPANSFRAWEMLCLEDGSEADGSAYCRSLYQGLKEKWEHRLQAQPAIVVHLPH